MWPVGVLGVGGVLALVWTEELGEEHPGDRFSSHSRASRCNTRAGQSSLFKAVNTFDPIFSLVLCQSVHCPSSRYHVCKD